MLMIAMASGEREAAELAARVFTELAIQPIGDTLGGPDGKERALQMSILAIGFVFFMKHLPLTVFGEQETERICDWFTRSNLDVTEPKHTGPLANSAVWRGGKGGVSTFRSRWSPT